VQPYEIFRDALENDQQVEQALERIGTRRLAYTTNSKGHAIYARANSHLLISAVAMFPSRSLPGMDEMTGVQATQIKQIIRGAKSILDNSGWAGSTGRSSYSSDPIQNPLYPLHGTMAIIQVIIIR
jgi:hypothetical protein